MLTTILFVLSMFVAIWMSMLIVVRTIYCNEVSWQMIFASIAWTAVITHILHIW